MNEYAYICGNRIISREHMLSAKEIAAKYWVATVSGNPAAKMVSHWIHDVTPDEEDRYYYETAHGVMEVYPLRVYMPAMEKLYDMFESCQGCCEYISPGRYGKPPVKLKFTLGA